ncbi:zinc finger protein 570-like [Anabrus simplex]|uniref:zinc finger protein 570-like n=1 Tax=Anabrus simplex TaxID=316456 RepID=UPI0035A3049B
MYYIVPDKYNSVLKSMEEPVFVKCEPAWPADTEKPSNFEENAVQTSYVRVKIKEDPHAAIAELSLQEPSSDIKKEISVDEHAVGQLVACFKEEDKLKSMEEPVFVKCELAWPADTEKTSNFEENAVRTSDIRVKIKEDPHAAIADLSLQEPSVYIKDEIVKEENNLEDFARLTEVPVLSSDDSRQAFNEGTRIKCQSLSATAEVSDPPFFCSNTVSQDQDVMSELLTTSPAMRFVCKLCNESFSKKELIHEHLSIHFRLHICEVCNKTFARMSYKKRHMLTHSTEKPFFCNICDKKFKRERSLRIHKEMHIGEKPYSCNVCGKKFCIRNELSNHTATHSVEKPYICSVCKSGFAQKYTLNRHMAVHSKQRQFPCNVCSRVFEFKATLTRHLLTHSKIKAASLYCNAMQ